MIPKVPEELIPPLFFIAILSVVLLYIYIPYMWKWSRELHSDYHRWKREEIQRREKLENLRLRKMFYQRRLMYGRAYGAKCTIDPEHLVEGQIVYTYRTDRPFYVTSTGGRYGLNCSSMMVCYRNLFDTDDAEAETLWHLEESIFLKQFYTYGENINEYNEQQIRSLAN